MNDEPLKLTEAERREMRHLDAQAAAVRDLAQQVHARMLVPLQADMAAFWRDVLARMGLPFGAMGTTHEYDPATASVVPKGGGEPPAPAKPKRGPREAKAPAPDPAANGDRVAAEA